MREGAAALKAGPGQWLGQVKGRGVALGAALMASGVATALSPSARRVVACGGGEAQQRCRQGRSKAMLKFFMFDQIYIIE